jgi:hypothetical protein
MAALGDASVEKITDFRQRLKAGEKIMDARLAIHGRGPFDQTKADGSRLGRQWKLEVVQFRWYDENAYFWLDAESTPFQIDRIMRRTLIELCNLRLEQGVREFQICGSCEHRQSRVSIRWSGKKAWVWIEVPDHWGSDAATGDDGENRPAQRFIDTHDQLKPARVPDGDAAIDPKATAADPQGEPAIRTEVPKLDPSAAGSASMVIAWDATAKRDPELKPWTVSGSEVPAKETTRIQRIQLDAARAKTGFLPAGSDDQPAQEAIAVNAAPSPEGPVAPGRHGSGGIQPPDLDFGTGRALFGRFFTNSAAGDDDSYPAELIDLAKNMVADPETGPPKAFGEDEDENVYIPAIYTYFGQFIAHDLTFDPSSIHQREVDKPYQVDYRTPRFDLDSLYGGGPAQQPYLYDGDRFALPKYRPDLPRTDSDLAIIADPRNDENRLISQLTLLWMRFHNRLVDEGANFGAAVEKTRWTYQWLVANDYLPTVCGEDRVAQVCDNPRLQIPEGDFGPAMPLELAAAALRFGHSMVRPSYVVNESLAGQNLTRIPIFPSTHSRFAPSLVGHRKVKRGEAVDWKFFAGDRQRGATNATPQPSYRIDTKIVEPLGHLDRADLVSDGIDSLAARTLLRGHALGLPSGFTVAYALQDCGYSDCAPLTEVELDLNRKELPLCAKRPPLWYYVLREAEVARGGNSLGPVGGTLVAEGLLGLLRADPSAFTTKASKDWQPVARTLEEFVRYATFDTFTP